MSLVLPLDIKGNLKPEITTEQLSSGGEYKDLRKTIVIGIFNYNMLKNDSYEGIQKVGDFLNSNSNVGGVFWQLFMP